VKHVAPQAIEQALLAAITLQAEVVTKKEHGKAISSRSRARCGGLVLDDTALA
jgi:hypothetical protein